MRRTEHLLRLRSAVHEHDNSLFMALELSKSTWLIAVSAPGSDKISKYRTSAADTAAVLSLLSRLKAQAERRCGQPVKLVAIYEAGLDGFWVHRLLEATGVESHVIDAASIAVDRRRRRVKTDRVDVEKLLRTLMGWARGERGVCSMVRPPSPEEDARRLTRERETLVVERVRHVNRIKGLLATQGVFDFEPTRRDRRKRLEELRRWDGQPLPPRLKVELVREIDRLELVMSQLATLEAERDRALQINGGAVQNAAQRRITESAPAGATGRQLLRLRGVGPETASVISLEAFYRKFANRREVASYSGLAPSPWKSGGIDIEQGISKAGNPRLRKTMIQLAWLWLQHQPGSVLSQWFHERVGDKRQDSAHRHRRRSAKAVGRALAIHYARTSASWRRAQGVGKNLRARRGLSYPRIGREKDPQIQAGDGR